MRGKQTVSKQEGSFGYTEQSMLGQPSTIPILVGGPNLSKSHVQKSGGWWVVVIATHD